MKRTVYNTVIGLMLFSGLAMTSTGAMAQGRRPASTNNAAAAGNRSVATASPKTSNAATVSNNTNNVSSRSTMSQSVSTRPTTSGSSVVNRTTTTTPKVNTAGNRSSSSSAATTVAPKVVTSGSSSSTVRPSGNNSGSTVINKGSNNSGSTVRPSAGNRSAGGTATTVTGNSSNVRPTGNSGSTVRTTGNNGSTVRPTGNNNGKGHVERPSSRPANRPKVAGKVLTGGGPKIDYSTYRYTSSWRPRYDGDRFFNSFRYNSWSWRNPIRPSVRPWRHSTIWVYRPIVTINVSRYSSYPTIGGVLGLTWGTSYGNALNYLYYNGYYIDGFMDNIVYLTDVELLDYEWDDVMLQFDGNDNLDYVEFSYWDDTFSTSRFYSLYNFLCSMYGSPVSYNNSMYSWYGGDGIGFVNLGMEYTSSVSYTVLAFGV